MLSNIKNFSNVKVLVLGDVMLDKYLWGKVNRISPEAPVPVINLEKTTLTAGGAANVAANISGLGADVFLIGAVGNDSDGESFTKVLKEANVSCEYLVKLKRHTTKKTRIVAHNQHIARIDQEDSEPIDNQEEDKVWNQIVKVFDQIDIVLISDYAKGVITKSLSQRLINLARKNNKQVIVDPKGDNYEKYRLASVLTPNLKEAFDANDSENAMNLELIGQELLSKLNLQALLITQGENGMSLFQKDLETKSLDALARKVYDVTGAGDTVIATLTVAIGAGIDFYNSAKLANIAAGLVVEQIGTTTISFDELKTKVLEEK